MNSVALPTTGGGGQILSVEADLVRHAARGDAESFSELFRRHSAPAWRLAQAVTADRESAVGVFRDGFVRAVRSSRPVRRSGGTFRLHVLSEIYKSAADRSYDTETTPSAAVRQKGGPDAALAYAAFHSLPERWRAAVWLSEVENFDSDRMAGVLGVSPGVAEQLVGRGLKGLAGRYQQARREMPAQIGDVLRPLALAVPADLDVLTVARWSITSSDHLTSMVPLARWLDDHAARPLAVAAGALVGLGLIGLGVIPGGNGLQSQLGASGSSGVYGSQTIAACVGTNCPPSSSGALSKPGSAPGNGFVPAIDRALGIGAGTTAATGSTQTLTTPNSPPGSTSTNPTSPGKPQNPNPPAVGPSQLGIPGVATLTLSGGTLTASLLNGTATATATDTAGNCSVSASAGSSSEGASCKGTPSSSANSNNTSTSALGPVTGTVKQVVTGATGTVSSVVSTVTGSSASTTPATTSTTPATPATNSTTTGKGLLSGL